MTSPAAAKTDTSGDRRYTIVVDGNRYEYPSVSTVLGKLDKPGITNFKIKQVALGVAADPHLQALALAGEEYRAARLCLDTQSEATIIGDAVHDAVEAHVKGMPMPIPPAGVARNLIMAHVAQFDRAVAEHGIVPIESEVTVFNQSLGLAGTTDLIALVPAIDPALPIVCDYKTGARVYPETAMQLAGYALGEAIYERDGDVIRPMPKINPHKGAIIALHADRYSIIPVELDDAADAIRAARVIYEWKSQYEGLVLGPPVRPINPDRERTTNDRGFTFPDNNTSTPAPDPDWTW